MSPAFSSVLGLGMEPEALAQANVSGVLLFRLWVLYLWTFLVFIPPPWPFPPAFLFFFFTFLILLLPTAFQGPTTFHLNQISSFANSTWAQNRGSGWLGDLQIHGWDSESGTAIFLKPWSKGNLSDEEVTELVEIFRVYLIGFLRVIQDHVSEFQLTCECCSLERLPVISLSLLFRTTPPGLSLPSSQFIQLL